MEKKKDLSRDVLGLFKEIGRARTRATASAWLELPLSLPQFKMLVLIAQAETPSTLSHIAERLGIGEPAASYLVEKLVQAGYAERGEDPMDRRKSSIRLSKNGLVLLEKFTLKEEWLAKCLSTLESEDLVALHRGLSACLAALQASAR